MQYSHMYAPYSSPYEHQHQHPPPPPPQPPPSTAYESSPYPGSPSVHSPTASFYAAGASASDPMLAQVYSSSAALDPIDGAYGPQALSTASPPAFAGEEHAMLDGEADMLQASGLNAFDDVAARAFATEPPAVQPVPRSYSYPTPTGMHARAEVVPVVMASSPAAAGPSDAYERLRLGTSLSITPGAGGDSSGASALQQAMKARLAGPARTAPSPAISSFRQSFALRQPPPPRAAEAYPGYSAANPVYDLYGSSFGAGHEQSPQAQQQAPPIEPVASAFSQNPTAPSDPYDPKALGLPLPPPRVSTQGGGSQTSNSYQNIYSTSGFDLVGVLARVVNRKSPTIEIGAVDMSCSFVVVDARKFDQPIIYASETFSRLTGYANEEIVGRNCRFLQAPGDQTVLQGEKRRYTDGNAAHHLRKHIVEGQETQVSLINYHKGGKPFINLVTCVPITWGDSDEVAFFVGFQVDLVDQPAAILDKMQNGSYIVNYSVVHATIARNPSVISFDPTGAMEHFEDPVQQAHPHAAHTVSKAGAPATSVVKQVRDQIRADDPAELLVTVADGGTGALANEGMRRQFMRLLVDECDDFIHVLSLKGALLYVSGASRRLLEYEPGELLGKTLSSFCHPSDIVSVQRELKDAGVAAHPTVSLVYRIRRKNSGYVWFEAQGRLHLEPGKGRKCVILSGRPREVYKMSWRDLELAGGVGTSAHEFWAKVCVDGIFLTATQSAEKVLGVGNVTEDVVGKSIGDLTRRVRDDAQRFMAALSDASRGHPSQVQHFMAPSPGAPLVEVVTRFYPARSATDAAQNQPPPTEHFQPVAGKQVAVIAQICLAGHDRARAGRAASAVAVGSVAGRSATSSTRGAATSSVSGSGASSSVATGARSSSLASHTPTDAAVTSATTASASSAGVAVPAPLVAAAVPGMGPPGLTSFSAVPSTFKALAAPSSVSDNVFDELNVTRGTSWQFELHQMRLTNKKLREEREALEALIEKKELLAKVPAAQKTGPTQRACANCGRTQSAEWRSGPTGPKTLCNACGLRWSKAKSQAAAAAKQRKEDENKVKAEAASHSASRSGSRDSTGSGSGSASADSGSTNPTTIVPSPSLAGSYRMSPSAPAIARVHSARGFAGYTGGGVNMCASAGAASPLALYAPMSLAPSPMSAIGCASPQPTAHAHQPSTLQHMYAPHPHTGLTIPSPYLGGGGPGPPPPHGPA
ncbi:hypothetical protein JCM3770_001059 [Rhodotorula araucariae]